MSLTGEKAGLSFKITQGSFSLPVSGVLKTIFCTSLLLLPIFLNAQQKNFPLNRQWNLLLDKKVNSIHPPDTSLRVNIYMDGTRSHTAFKPLIEGESFDMNLIRSENYGYHNMPGPFHTYPFTPPREKKWLFRKIRRDHLFIINDTADKFHLTIDPIFNFEFGKNLNDTLNEKLFMNTRGVLIRGDVGSKFSFESSFYENQGRFMAYIDSFNQKYLVVPGQGRWKDFRKDTANPLLSGYDFAMASGYVSFSPNKHFNFQAGHGKHFVGDGYRSLLLSDNAFNYPFIRITTTFGPLQYTNLYTVFMNMSFGATPPGTERLFQKKAGNFHFLSLNLLRRVQLGIFEGTIAPGADYRNKQDIEGFFFNPVIFGNAVKYGLRGAYNVLLGSTLKVKITSKISLYGQYVLDDMASEKGSVHNKQGFQAGVKYFDVAGIKNLHLQLEYNQVHPYTYSRDTLNESYTHYNQALAHPLGANFKEGIVFLNYRIGDFFTEFKFMYAMIGKDSAGIYYGNDIFKSSVNAYYGSQSTINMQNQGVQTTLMHKDFRIGYLINPSTNMNIVFGISDRNYSNVLSSDHSLYVYFAFRTSLVNYYYDF